MLKHCLILLLLTCTLVCSGGSIAVADAPSDASEQLVDAGSAVAPAAPTAKAADLPNPATSPVAAYDEAKLARKTSWPLAVWAALAMLGKGLAYGRERLKGLPLIGRLAEWLSVGKRAMWLAAFGAVGSAGYDVLMQGGTLTAAMIASGIALAGVTHSTTKGVEPKPATT